MQQLLVFQSLWAMERRHTDGHEPSLVENLDRIRAAGYDGVSFNASDPVRTREVTAYCHAHGLRMEWQCFPQTVDDLAPAYPYWKSDAKAVTPFNPSNATYNLKGWGAGYTVTTPGYTP